MNIPKNILKNGIAMNDADYYYEIHLIDRNRKGLPMNKASPPRNVPGLEGPVI